MNNRNTLKFPRAVIALILCACFIPWAQAQDSTCAEQFERLLIFGLGEATLSAADLRHMLHRQDPFTLAVRGDSLRLHYEKLLRDVKRYARAGGNEEAVHGALLGIAQRLLQREEGEGSSRKRRKDAASPYWTPVEISLDAEVSSIALSNDGARFVAQLSDGPLILWDKGQGRPRELPVSVGSEQVAMTGNGSYAAWSGPSPGFLALDGEPRLLPWERPKSHRYIKAGVFDSSLLGATAEGLELWSLDRLASSAAARNGAKADAQTAFPEPTTRKIGFQNLVPVLALSRDSRWAHAVLDEHPESAVWDILENRWHQPANPEWPFAPTAAQFSQDGSQLMVADYSHLYRASVPALATLGREENPDASVGDLSSDGLAFRSERVDGWLHYSLYDFNVRENRYKFPLGWDVWLGKFSPSGDFLITTSRADHKVRIWDLSEL